MKKLVGILFALLLSSSGEANAEESVRHKLDNVVRVFMHKPGDYSVMTQEGERFKVCRLWDHFKPLLIEKNRWKWNKTQFSQELQKSADGKMRVLVIEDESSMNVRIVIFITGEKDVNGAGWEESRGPKKPVVKGTTSVVR